MIPNKKITMDEFHDLITWRKLTYGGNLTYILQLKYNISNFLLYIINSYYAYQH